MIKYSEDDNPFRDLIALQQRPVFLNISDTEKEKFTVLRSPHVNKKSREQFQLCTYKRLVDIYSNSAKTVDALMKLELPSGVDVEIKV